MSDDEAATAAVETPAPAAQPVSQDDPQWLPARLARKEKELLKALGADSIDAVRSKLARAEELEKAQLTEAEKMRARVAELEAAAKDRDEYRGALSVHVNAALAGLTEAQREAVIEAAGDSPAKQMRMLEKLKPTWAVASQQAQPKPVHAPAQTAPAATAPPATASAGENLIATYEALNRSNPMAAAAWRHANANAYYAALNASKQK